VLLASEPGIDQPLVLLLAFQGTVQAKIVVLAVDRDKGLASSRAPPPEASVLASCAEAQAAEGVAPVPFCAGTAVLRVGPMISRFAGEAPGR
jgi:hypothetical protein